MRPSAYIPTAAPLQSIDWAMVCRHFGWQSPPVLYLPDAGTLDLSPYGNHGTLGDGSNPDTFPSPVGSLTGGAYDFDGSDDYVNVVDSSELDGMNELTVSVWAYFAEYETTIGHSNEWNSIIEKFADGHTYSYQSLATGDIEYTFVLGTDNGGEKATFKSDMTQFVGEWHQLIGTYNGTHMVTYFDSAQQDSVAHTGTVKTNDNTLKIGGRGSSNVFFDGTIDEVMIFPCALTAAQVRDLYHVKSVAAWAARNRMGVMA